MIMTFSTVFVLFTGAEAGSVGPRLLSFVAFEAAGEALLGVDNLDILLKY